MILILLSIPVLFTEKDLIFPDFWYILILCRFYARPYLQLVYYMDFIYLISQRSPDMNISYDSYRVFYYAAKYKSFSQAAAALYNNQPNVTRIIKRLEAELHCVLFFRSSQGVRLTPEGEKLYAHIAVAFESIEAGEEELLSDQSLAGGSIHIAASGLALQGCLLRVLSRYRRQYPHVHIYLTNNSTPQGLSAVQNGLADFAVVSEGTVVPDSLEKQWSVKFKRSRSAGPPFPR